MNAAFWGDVRFSEHLMWNAFGISEPVPDICISLLKKKFETMSRVCQVTGKRPITGNNVSHAHNKTRRRFLPNLQKKRFYVPTEDRWVTLKVSAKGIKQINRRGIEAILKEIKERDGITL